MSLDWKTISDDRLHALTRAGLLEDTLFDRRRMFLAFIDKYGRLPMFARIGDYVMIELDETFKVGCQEHTFKWWASNLDRCADRFRATRSEREGARALINAARIARGMRRMAKT